MSLLRLERNQLSAGLVLYSHDVFMPSFPVRLGYVNLIHGIPGRGAMYR